MASPAGLDELRELLAQKRIDKVVEYKWRPTMQHPHRDYIRVYVDGTIAWDGPVSQEAIDLINKARGFNG
jgi:hypothetical protein